MTKKNKNTSDFPTDVTNLVAALHTMGWYDLSTFTLQYCHATKVTSKIQNLEHRKSLRLLWPEFRLALLLPSVDFLSFPATMIQTLAKFLLILHASGHTQVQRVIENICKRHATLNGIYNDSHGNGLVNALLSIASSKTEYLGEMVDLVKGCLACLEDDEIPDIRNAFKNYGFDKADVGNDESLKFITIFLSEILRRLVSNSGFFEISWGLFFLMNGNPMFWDFTKLTPTLKGGIEEAFHRVNIPPFQDNQVPLFH